MSVDSNSLQHQTVPLVFQRFTAPARLGNIELGDQAGTRFISHISRSAASRNRLMLNGRYSSGPRSLGKSIFPKTVRRVRARIIWVLPFPGFGKICWLRCQWTIWTPQPCICENLHVSQEAVRCRYCCETIPLPTLGHDCCRFGSS